VLLQGLCRGILPVGVVLVSTGIGDVSAGLGHTRATVVLTFDAPQEV
jgi:hypothetical protein